MDDDKGRPAVSCSEISLSASFIRWECAVSDKPAIARKIGMPERVKEYICRVKICNSSNATLPPNNLVSENDLATLATLTSRGIMPRANSMSAAALSDAGSNCPVTD